MNTPQALPDPLPAPKASTARILCLGDVNCRPGRELLRKHLPELRSTLGAAMVVANGENAAGGIGLTPGALSELRAAGVDVVTSGNHIWRYREIHPCLDRDERVLRPGNYGNKVPGRGWTVFRLPCGFGVGVLNLLGRTFMDPVACPFAAADAALPLLKDAGADAVLLDFHAEASSEKRAMVHYLDGRAAAVLGTHTHVQTADAHVTSSGTAALTDLGMCGVERESVIGMDGEAVLKRFVTGLPQRFVPAKGEGAFNGALVEIDKNSGKSLSIRLVRGKPAALL